MEYISHTPAAVALLLLCNKHLVDAGGGLRVHGGRVVKDGPCANVAVARGPARPHERGVGAHPAILLTPPESTMERERRERGVCMILVFEL